MKTAVVTGANAGLGFACASELAKKRDWSVILACRDVARGEEAIRRIKATTPSAKVEVRRLDLGALDGVRRFVEELGAGGLPPLAALVCNAGVQVTKGITKTAEGFESTFGVNHLGHFLLIRRVLPLLEAGGRIVLVSSNTHDPKRLTGMPHPELRPVEELAHGLVAEGTADGRAGRLRYTTSKLCNVLCAYELDRRLKAAGDERRLCVNAFDPGFMPATDLARDYGPLARWMWRWVLPAVTPFIRNANSVGVSGRRLAALAADPAYGAVSGRYYSRGRDTRSSEESYDEAKAAQLWNGSCAVLNIPSELGPCTPTAFAPHAR